MSARNVELARRRARMAMERTPTPKRHIAFELVRSGPVKARMRPESVAAYAKALLQDGYDHKKLIRRLRWAGWEVYISAVDGEERRAELGHSARSNGIEKLKEMR